MRLYKCFDKGLINRYGVKFELNKLYHTDGEIKFGNDGNGFHMCTYLEDTFRYFDAMNGEVEVCLVNGTGDYVKRDDENNDSFDMYVYENMVIEHIYTREELFDYAMNLPEHRLKRFISLYRFTEEERRRLIDKYRGNSYILNFIDYYQNGNDKAFDSEYDKKAKIRSWLNLKKVLNLI